MQWIYCLSPPPAVKSHHPKVPNTQQPRLPDSKSKLFQSQSEIFFLNVVEQFKKEDKMQPQMITDDANTTAHPPSDYLSLYI